ncbi:MAG: hypothetical protein ABIA04_06195, partial [Pseudomonadota bacterium]
MPDFIKEETRSVKKDRTFKLNGKIYEAPLIAGSGSVIDFYEQMALALNVDHVSRRRPTLLKAIR